ncbi:Antichymotrypsin-1 [Papilio xuthus]|uniref:Antichymotrypsin-1 n=2 Tax=Papilio xuthus TaxID=66420 RepID=A0A194QKV5_PAPXU|nr:Antichymotrypsin-1 [Papilio xuthus]
MEWLSLLLLVTVASTANSLLDHEYSRTRLGDNIDKASVKLLKEAYLSSDGNVVTSPLGVLFLLSLYSSGTQGKTRDEITELLGATDYKEMFDSYSGLSNEYASMNSSLSLANKIYVASGYDLNEEFLNTARAYNTEVDSVDFHNVENAAHEINQWANKKLRGLIKDPVKKTSLDKDALVALFNVIYFKGHWHVPFKVESTEIKDFHVNKSYTIKKPMMHLSKSLFFHADDQLGAKMIELPYQEPGFRMVVILPNEIDGLSNVLEKVAQKGLLEDVFALSPARRKVNLYLPKFDIKSSLDFTQILPKLGVKGIFTGGSSGIVKDANVAISKIFQEAVVNVDEEGAKAGAFTGYVAVKLSYDSTPPPPKDFIVDHPFLFAILHNEVDRIIQIGPAEPRHLFTDSFVPATLAGSSTHLVVVVALAVEEDDFFFFGHEYKRTELGNAVDKASMRLLKDLYDSSEEKNVITSPLGVLTLLSLYSTGTTGKIKEEIVNFLGLPDYKKMTESYKSLTEKFTDMNPEFLTMANKVCVASRYELTDEFAAVATRDYHSEVQTLNFTNPSEAAKIINEWADQKTRGNIKNPVDEDTFSPDTAAALFNIIFFQMIELPYKEAGFRMVVVLPDAVDGLPAVLDKLAQKGVLEDVFAMSPPGQDVDVDMPKFEVKSKFNLKNVLVKEGVSSIFNQQAEGIVKGQGLEVSEVFQEAFVKVDEEGATAGAFTGLVLVATSLLSEPPPPLPFKVDRPFLYAILHQDIVLFAGTYTH